MIRHPPFFIGQPLGIKKAEAIRKQDLKLNTNCQTTVFQIKPTVTVCTTVHNKFKHLLKTHHILCQALGAKQV